MTIHEIADELRKMYPDACGIWLFVNQTEHVVEQKFYTGRGEYTMKRVDGQWCHETMPSASTPTPEPEKSK